MNAPIVPQRIEHWPLARLKPYVELDPVYCDVAVLRWEIATGKTALRTVDQLQDIGRNGV